MPDQPPQKVNTNDRQWFLDMVGKHHARLRAYIRCMGVRGEEVDDMAQEALLLAYQKRGQFDVTANSNKSKKNAEEAFGAWVRQIARRLIANERRKQHRRQRILSENVTDIMIEQAEALTPAMLHDQKDQLSLLNQCLEGLPENSKQLIHQRYFLDLSPEAIASRLGRNSNQVRQQLHRLRKSLLTCLQKRVETGGAI